MTRTALIWMVVIVGAAFLLYTVKYRVQALKTQVAETSHELETERESLHVVAAEWAYLNRPQRLKALAEKYLGATDLTAGQVADVDAVPLAPRMQAFATPEPGLQQAAVLTAR
jgi:hypothetical protein